MKEEGRERGRRRGGRGGLNRSPREGTKKSSCNAHDADLVCKSIPFYLPYPSPRGATVLHYVVGVPDVWSALPLPILLSLHPPIGLRATPS